LAEPLTLTGSIGVLGGKMVLADLWKKIGVNWAGMQFGQNAGILSANRKFTPSEKDAFNRSLDNVYKDFTSKVSEARKISLTDLDKLARGRIWSGISAVQHKLVDANGGIGEALLKVSELIGSDNGARYRVVTFPRAKTLPEKINELLSVNPRVSVKGLAEEIGLPVEEFKMLQRLQYDAVMFPVKIAM
jgi:protease-4